MVAHPSKDIVASRGEELEGKKIVLCITCSIAAYKCPEIARELMRHGAEVYTVISRASEKLIHPNLMEWATGNPVVTELTGRLEHIDLAEEGRSDLVLVCPATANTISKIACGIDDTSVTSVVSTAIGSKTPILIAPAAHEAMYQNPLVSENMEKLKAIGIEFIGPKIEEGKAKIADTQVIVDSVIRRLSSKRDLDAVKLLVTAGPTVEYIDPIRVITNRSSGKMGLAIVEEAMSRGAYVTLIYGAGHPTFIQPSRMINVETTEEMRDAVLSELKREKYDAFLSVAAAADYAPESIHKEKIRSDEKPSMTLNLRVTNKIIELVKQTDPNIILIPFKAEYNVSNEELIKRAYERLKSSKADLIVANDVGRVGSHLGDETNEVIIVDKEGGSTHIPLTSKREVAKRILDMLIEVSKRK